MNVLVLLAADSPPLPLVLLAVAVAFGLLLAIGKVLGGKPAPPPASDDRPPRERAPLAPPKRAPAPIPPPAPSSQPEPPSSPPLAAGGGGPTGPREPSPALLREVADLLRAGKKINAIKRYREETGLNLKESKQAVDAMEAGGVPASASAAAPPGNDEDIRDFLRAGKKIHAIKLYRERYGTSLKEAKDAVERM